MWIRQTEQRDSLEILIKLEHVYRDTFPSGLNWERIWGWKINTNIHQPVKWKQAPLPGRGLAYSWPYREEHPVTRVGWWEGGGVRYPPNSPRKKNEAIKQSHYLVRYKISAKESTLTVVRCSVGKGGRENQKGNFDSASEGMKISEQWIALNDN